jgi:Cu+-exporting ATPase
MKMFLLNKNNQITDNQHISEFKNKSFNNSKNISISAYQHISTSKNISISAHQHIETCFHCGEDCKEEEIILDQKHFCCTGCKSVYQLLSENNLAAYYKLEKTPGSSIKNPSDSQKYAYLDLADAQDELLEFRENGIAKMTISIPKIHCSSCVYLLENLTKLNSGIKSVMVDFVKRQATITFEETQISLRQVAELLHKIGYTPDLSRNKNKQNNSSATSSENSRILAFKIGLAGFCFGNIMLLSFPEYFSIDEAVLVEYQPFFGALNFILALPVFLYCAQDYYVSAWASLRQRMISIDVPIVLGIFALFGRSSYEIFTHTGAGYMDSLAGLLFFLLIGKWYQSKTYQALSFERDYTAYFPIATSRILEDKTEQQVMIQHLEEGDIIKIRNQEIIPTDSVLLSTQAAIDYSFVSGESDTIDKQEGDKIYAGGRQMGGAILLKVLKKVNQSYFTQLWNQHIFDKKKNLLLSETINKRSYYFTIAILIIAFSALFYWSFVDYTKALMAFSAVLIIACPCALALTAPFAFGNMLRLLGKQGFFLKNALTVEQLSGVTDIIFDKTGTLTTNNATKIHFIGEPLSTFQNQAVKALTQHSTHPLSQMLFQHLSKENSLPEVFHYKEIEGKGIEGWIDGKLMKIGSASFVGLTSSAPQLLASQVYVFYDNKELGFFNIEKEYRQGMENVLNSLGKNFQLHLLSGDNDSEKDHLESLFKGINNMRFHQAPLDKLKYVKE